MTGRRKFVIGVASAMLIALGVVVLTGRREPSYQNKKLSYWVLKAAQENWTQIPGGSPPRYVVSPEVEAAILAIGTNGIPFYLDWLPYEPNRLKKVQMYIADTSRKWVKHRWFANYKPMARSLGSAVALNLLGDKAESAIPTLVEYATNHTISSTAHGEAVAFGCLASVGKASLPVFFELMTNSSPDVRKYAMHYSLQISTNSAVMEKVRERLQDPDSEVRSQATSQLRRFGKGR